MEASLLRKHMVRLPVVHRSYPGTCCCFFPRREAPRSVLSCPFPGHMRTRLHPPTPATTLGLPLPAPTSLLGRSPSIAAPHPHPPRPSPERSPRCLPSTPSMNDELKMQEGGRSSSAIVKGESAGGGGRDAEGGSVVGLAQATQSHSRALRVPHPRARLPNSVQRDPRSLARHCLHRGLAAPRVHRGPSEKGGRESYSLLPPAASPLAAPPLPIIAPTSLAWRPLLRLSTWHLGSNLQEQQAEESQSNVRRSQVRLVEGRGEMGRGFSVLKLVACCVGSRPNTRGREGCLRACAERLASSGAYPAQGLSMSVIEGKAAL